jgi:hypothetical protein
MSGAVLGLFPRSGARSTDTHELLHLPLLQARLEVALLGRVQAPGNGVCQWDQS